MSWANQFKTYIGADTVQNMAQNNAGYVNEPTFLSQLQAVNNKTKITHIIIAGGANDKLQTTTAITNAVKTHYNTRLLIFQTQKYMSLPSF